MIALLVLSVILYAITVAFFYGFFKAAHWNDPWLLADLWPLTILLIVVFFVCMWVGKFVGSMFASVSDFGRRIGEWFA